MSQSKASISRRKRDVLSHQGWRCRPALSLWSPRSLRFLSVWGRKRRSCGRLLFLLSRYDTLIRRPVFSVTAVRTGGTGRQNEPRSFLHYPHVRAVGRDSSSSSAPPSTWWTRGPYALRDFKREATPRTLNFSSVERVDPQSSTSARGRRNCFAWGTLRKPLKHGIN